MKNVVITIGYGTEAPQSETLKMTDENAIKVTKEFKECKGLDECVLELSHSEGTFYVGTKYVVSISIMEE